MIKLIKPEEVFDDFYVVGSTVVQTLFRFGPECYQQLFTKINERGQHYGQDPHGRVYKSY